MLKGISITFEKKTPWPESASELFRLSDSRLSAKLVSTFADRGCHVVSVTDPYGRILGFSDRIKFGTACKYFVNHQYISILVSSQGRKRVGKTQMELERTSLKNW
jgi:hypothetical protein